MKGILYSLLSLKFYYFIYLKSMFSKSLETANLKLPLYRWENEVGLETQFRAHEPLNTFSPNFTTCIENPIHRQDFVKTSRWQHIKRSKANIFYIWNTSLQKSYPCTLSAILENIIPVKSDNIFFLVKFKIIFLPLNIILLYNWLRTIITKTNIVPQSPFL